MLEPTRTRSFGLAPTPPVGEQVVKCPLCSEPFREPKVLACFHSFCKSCLKDQMGATTPHKVVCPQCRVETQLSVQRGVDGLLSDYGLEIVLSRQQSSHGRTFTVGSPDCVCSSPAVNNSLCDHSNNNDTPSMCTGCGSGDAANAFCQDCGHLLCDKCVVAHQHMHCFEGHRVGQLLRAAPPALSPADVQSPCKCVQHETEVLRYFCLTCDLPICDECTVKGHPSTAHHYEPIDNIAPQQMRIIHSLLRDAHVKHSHLTDMFKVVDAAQKAMNNSLERAHRSVEEGARALMHLVEETRGHVKKQLDSAYSARQRELTIVDKKVQEVAGRLAQTVEFAERLVKYATPTGVLVFKRLLDARLQKFLSFNLDISRFLRVEYPFEQPPLDTDFAHQQIMTLMGLTVGANDSSPAAVSFLTAELPPTPIGRPPSHRPLNGAYGGGPISSNYSDSNLLKLKHEFGRRTQSMDNFAAAVDTPANRYQKWSMGLEPSSATELVDSPGLDPASKSPSADSLCSPYSQVKRRKMVYFCKFGEFGVMEGQFTEPSGVAVNAYNEVVVADTNNHRVQVFSKDGRFKFQFGEQGKRNVELMQCYKREPRMVSEPEVATRSCHRQLSVAVNRMTGDFVIAERSPTHQIQIYDHCGQFMRRFGANVLEHPRGICVDNKGRIIVVECKVMRVAIFDMFGNLLQKFSCFRHLDFPNGVCTNDREEIFISDNRAHCVKVFSYSGEFVREIGGEGITNYPIGVGLNSAGDVLIADNHNNFNLTLFTQEGAMLSALESRVKHAQCFDMAVMDEGCLVLASKDYRLYLCRYSPD